MYKVIACDNLIHNGKLYRNGINEIYINLLVNTFLFFLLRLPNFLLIRIMQPILKKKVFNSSTINNMNICM